MPIYTSYVDASFLKNHRKNMPVALSDLVDSDELKNWKSVNEFILTGCVVKLYSQGIEPSDLQEENPIAFSLLNDYYSGKRTDLSILNNTDVADPKDETSLSVFYFIDEVKLGFSPASYGYIKYDSKKVKTKWLADPNKPKELVISGQELIGNQLKCWNNFTQFGIGTNSMVIMDNYIFNNEQNIRINFIPLIKSFYPKGLSNVPLDILVITKFLYPVNPFEQRTNWREETLVNAYKKIELELSSAFPKQPFTLSIIQKDKALNSVHDRNIITNYLRIKVSNSISFFDRNGNALMASDITFDPLPHICKNGTETFGDTTLLVFLKRAAEIVNAARGDSQSIGLCNNRLLEVYKNNVSKKAKI